MFYYFLKKGIFPVNVSTESRIQVFKDMGHLQLYMTKKLKWYFCKAVQIGNGDKAPLDELSLPSKVKINWEFHHPSSSNGLE